MKRLLKNKKGFNDTTIMFGILTLFVALGIVLPFINAEYGTSTPSNDVDGLTQSAGENEPTVLNAFSVFVSVFTMFFWSFGSLPVFLDILFIPLRIIFVMIIAKWIWGSGS